MRALLRFLFTFLSSVVVASCILCILFPSNPAPGPDFDRRPHSGGGLDGWFSFKDPASLFSPTATISLTDDNSTFFNAKPAAFGPLLPSKGLSGQIWVGSGFADDNTNRQGMAASVEGELGCADIPGWTDRNWKTNQKQEPAYPQQLKVSSSGPKAGTQGSTKVRRDVEFDEDTGPEDVPIPEPDDDGTDDYLHHPLPKTKIARPGSRKGPQPVESTSLEHADIQSLQEVAEITGKVVMLSRGGCGFAEKVKWAQRRGALAVIVADNVRGGPLVRMYARGNVANITIPSLFTSHTTAHLLSHLIPPSVDQFHPTGIKKVPPGKMLAEHAESTIDAHTSEPRPRLKHSANDPTMNQPHSEPVSTNQPSPGEDKQDSGRGWYSRLILPKSKEANNDHAVEGTKWLRVEDFEEDEAGNKYRNALQKTPSSTGGFVIGVQDWRDPDVVAHENIDSSSAQPIATSDSSSAARTNNLKGGSITPGSGEYEQPGDHLLEHHATQLSVSDTKALTSTDRRTQDGRSWLARLLWNTSKSSKASEASSAVGPSPVSRGKVSTLAEPYKKHPSHRPDHHVGLWVTLTPTDMNASPFLNTLFVLVVSPLITLAVVYSMLLLRSRIRRRRWRAPKSVVEQLPVRVYHTSSSRSTPVSETPIADVCTSTTPLLAASRPTALCNRAVHVADDTLASGSVPSSSQYGSLGASVGEQEKIASRLAEWKRKYGGKQRECVVCLDEYIDGVSRVMSLPCGHEFHVDCM